MCRNRALPTVPSSQPTGQRLPPSGTATASSQPASGSGDFTEPGENLSRSETPGESTPGPSSSTVTSTRSLRSRIPAVEELLDQCRGRVADTTTGNREVPDQVADGNPELGAEARTSDGPGETNDTPVPPAEARADTDNARPPTPEEAFDEVVHWRKRFVKIPTGAAGKSFVALISQQISKFVDSSGTDREALYNLAVLPILMLQRTRKRSSAKDNATHLQRRLGVWGDGDLTSLLAEGRCLQRLEASSRAGTRKQGDLDQARRFGDLMGQGRVQEALRTLSSESNRAGILQLDDQVPLADGGSMSVRDVLLEKHPPGRVADQEILLPGDAPPTNSIQFDAITADQLKSVALHAQGSAGPSGLDSAMWRRMCGAFKGASTSLCEALAGFTRLVATANIPADVLTPFLACRLIALDKNPGVRPIGVCEVLRRITAKAILQVVGPDVEAACGFLQKCSGLPAGIEAAVHAMQNMHEEESTEGILLVDASNAFNNLNRQAALHNVQRLCPLLATTLANCYQSPARLFVTGDGEIASREGTTQGDPLSMAFYAIATLPIINHLRAEHDMVRQIWYADDSGAVGRLQQLRDWWEELVRIGRGYGYYPNATKTLLLVKPGHAALANDIFDGTGVQVATEGAKYLGSAIGTDAFITTTVHEHADNWRRELQRLTQLAKTEPHAAHAALTHGLRGRWTYVMRTLAMPETDQLALDAAVVELLSTLTGRGTPLHDDELALLQLPCRLGGIGVPSFKSMACRELSASQAMTCHQVDEIIHQNDAGWRGKTPQVIHALASREKASAGVARRKEECRQYGTLEDIASRTLARRMAQLSSKGASIWLTALPLREHGFHLSKGDFRDALALRYGWQLQEVPATCGCGEPFTTTHAMCCPRGGFPTIRHNEVRDLMADCRAATLVDRKL